MFGEEKPNHWGNLRQLPEGSCWTDRMRSFASSVYSALVLTHTASTPVKRKTETMCKHKLNYILQHYWDKVL